MDTHDAATDIGLVAGHVRLLADLMLTGPDLQDVDRGAFAQVLNELAVRLERAVAALDSPGAAHHQPGEVRS